MKTIGISGGLTETSRTSILVKEILNRLQFQLQLSQSHFVSLSDIARNLSGAIWRSELAPAIEQELIKIEAADIIVLACPVYRASYPGLFKHFLDFIERKGFEKKIVILAACGGSQHHSLIIEQQLRPLVSGLGAFSAPTAIFTEAKDFENGQLVNSQVISRIDNAVDELIHLLKPQKVWTDLVPRTPLAKTASSL